MIIYSVKTLQNKKIRDNNFKLNAIILEALTYLFTYNTEY
jgi:hypothetical protein